MKPILVVALMVGFVAIAVFGPVAMGHGDDHSGCIAASSGSASCPGADDPVSFIAFHLKAFKNFSTATFDSQIIALVISLALALFGLAAPSHYGLILLIGVSFSGVRFGDQVVSIFKNQLISWLALHQNSPSF